MKASCEHYKKIIEAALLVSQEALTVKELKKLFSEEVGRDLIEQCLADIANDWQGKGVELCELASGWRFRARAEMQLYLARLYPERAPRYSRAVMETLAIVAYKQPVTRGEIEEIRGVTVSSHVIQSLKERGWLDVIGHKEVPGRPELLATNKRFLSDLGLKSLKDLPPLAELSGLLQTDATDEVR